MNIKETIESIKSLLKNQIKEDMDVESINVFNKGIQDCDAVLNEHTRVSTELDECKSSIIKLVKTQGDANPPKDPTEKDKPRSLEEIARDISNGGK